MSIGRITSRIEIVALLLLDELDAQSQSGRCLITRPTQVPTASGIPIGGCTSAETATPDGRHIDDKAAVAAAIGEGQSRRANLPG